MFANGGDSPPKRPPRRKDALRAWRTTGDRSRSASPPSPKMPRLDQEPPVRAVNKRRRARTAEGPRVRSAEQPQAWRARLVDYSSSSSSESDSESDEGDDVPVLMQQLSLEDGPPSLQRQDTVHINDSQEPGPSNWDPAAHYEMEKRQAAYSKKLKSDMSDFVLKFKDIGLKADAPELSDALDKMHSMLEHAFGKIRENTPPNTAGHLAIVHPDIDGINIRFADLNQLEMDTIMDAIEAKLNSSQSLDLSAGLKLHLIRTELPSGGSRNTGVNSANQKSFEKRQLLDLAEFLKRKQTVINCDHGDPARNLCLAKSLVCGKHLADIKPNCNESIPEDKKASFQNVRQWNRSKALKLHVEAGVKAGEKCTLDDVDKFQQYLADYQITVYASDVYTKPVYVGPNYLPKQIYLFLHTAEQHYYLISKPAGFFNSDKFCDRCKRGYHKNHYCALGCPLCHRGNCANTDKVCLEEMQQCTDCNRGFYSAACKAAHVGRLCERSAVCLICLREVPRKKLANPAQHHCMEVQCRTCGGWQPLDHKCYLKGADKVTEADLPAEEVDIRHLLGDMEFEQGYEDVDVDGNEVVEAAPEKQQAFHYADFESVIDKVSKVHKPILMGIHDVEGKDQWFQGLDCATQFLTQAFGDKKLQRCTVIYHNFSGYDAYAIVDAIHALSLKPNIIFRSSRVLTLQLPQIKMRFLDSALFMPMPLRAMPRCFGLDKELGGKGMFPYLFLTPENINTMTDLPPFEDYDAKHQKPKEADEMAAWWQGERARYDAMGEGQHFDVYKELKTYCNQDITILRLSAEKYRQQFKEMFDLDPFEFITLPSYINAVFRKKYMGYKQIAAIPPTGYGRRTHSEVSIVWLEWEAQKIGLEIRHARNGNEVRIGKYFADGYCDTPIKPTIYDFHGCKYHGCTVCTKPDDKAVRGTKTMRQLRAETAEREKYLLARGYNLVTKWGCEFADDRKNDPALADFYAKLMPRLLKHSPLNPRDSFRGGRTNAIRLTYVVKPGEEIHYDDFNSLYPSVNFGASGETYPVGHPKIYLTNFPPISQVYGLVHCTVNPPPRLYFPILPIICNEKVVFGLCGMCMRLGKNTFCRHSRRMRQIKGTFVSVELELALQHGYTIQEVYEVWHWSEKTDTLFRDFVADVYRDKCAFHVEASGWPTGVETDDQKAEYIATYKEKQGIKLRADKVQRNDVLRANSKFAANNMWGFFGKKCNPPSTVYVTDYAELCRLYASKKVTVVDSYLLQNDQMVVTVEPKEELNDGKTSVVIATFTTAWARRRLYEQIAIADRDCLYMDTASCAPNRNFTDSVPVQDSIIYVKRPGGPVLQTEDRLGGLADEILTAHGPHATIRDFSSSGAKSYAFTVVDKRDGSVIDETIKCKGLRLTAEIRGTLRKPAIDAAVAGIESRFAQMHIRRDKKKTILRSAEMNKVLRCTYTKRLLCCDTTTLPFGWVADGTETPLFVRDT